MSELVLVTGAAGFLGGHIARHLSGVGFRVSGLGHGDRSSAEWSRLGISNWSSGEISISALASQTETPDIIVHCAGGASVSASVENPDMDFRRTVDTTRDVLEYVRLHAPRARVILPSSAAIYGDVARLPISENTPPAPISPYGLHKLLSEELCQSYARQYGLKVAIVRLFSVYGPGLRKQLLWDACEKLSRGDSTFSGTGQELRDWLHVDDAVSLLAAAGEHASPCCPIVNGGSGQASTVAQVLQSLAEMFPKAAPLHFTGIARKGDPIGYEADTSRACAWNWRARVELPRGIAEYAAWYLRQAA